MTRYSSRRGMSLIEILVVVALFLLVTSMVAMLFQFSNRSTDQSAKRVDELNAGVRLSDALRRALASSYRSGNTSFYQTSPAPSSDLVLSVITTDDGTGSKGWDAAKQRPIFQGYRLFFLNTGTDRIETFHTPLAPTQVAQPFLEADILTLLASNPQTLPLVRNVASFSLYNPGDGSEAEFPTNPIGIRWTAGLGGGGKTVEFVCKIPNL